MYICAHLNTLKHNVKPSPHKGNYFLRKVQISFFKTACTLTHTHRFSNHPKLCDFVIFPLQAVVDEVNKKIAQRKAAREAARQAARRLGEEDYWGLSDLMHVSHTRYDR